MPTSPTLTRRSPGCANRGPSARLALREAEVRFGLTDARLSVNKAHPIAQLPLAIAESSLP
ncbi:hypothetical protein N4G70_12905 [Streptomyces sp. ASQP_92]|uniref:hypothetical protein n=1 Tax=Streptomyces sp. ASQP_92 TaxID=2979116 RepID=UPI0021BF7B01|nr:hypothetical protein [Streptomyces sp. ASQP_92]MCT9089763.1 hypothetical protein [Streptomyces sp. ASQP_92]